METSRYRAVTLDAHGVLLLPDPAAFGDAVGRFGAERDDERCWRAHYEMTELLDSMLDVDYERLNLSFAAALGIATDLHEAAAPILRDLYLSTRWVPAPGARHAVAELASRGFQLAVISNTAHGEIESVLARTGICAVGDSHRPVTAVLDSKVVGLSKPEPKIFEMALDALGVPAEQAVHVGDSYKDDVAGATAVGMTSVHIDPAGRRRRGDQNHAASLADWVANLP